MDATKTAAAPLRALNKFAAVLALVCSWVLFLDYLLPGSISQNVIKEYEVNSVKARGSASTTYNIVTDKYRFPISDEFLSDSNVGDTVRLEVSYLLKIVNTYSLKGKQEWHTYYTRYLSGIFFPLILLLLSLLSLRLKFSSENITYLFLALNALALFFTCMTVLNVSNLF